MKLKVQTNYAIHALLYLSRKECSTKKELMSVLGINENFLLKIERCLQNRKWIDTAADGTEEVRLTESPENITLLDVMEVTEGSMKGGPYLEGESGMEKPKAREGTQLYSFYQGLQKLTERYFSSITLRDLLEADEPESFSFGRS
jgi:DNA-binding IscR family transcriptional regulator